MKAKGAVLLIAIAGLLAVALAAAACGDDDDGDDGNGDATPTPASEEITAGDLTIEGPFARGALDNGAVFFTITNNGAEDDTLISASSNVSDTTELHETVTEGAESAMRPVEGIDIPAGGTTVLEPGGLHVMLLDLSQELNLEDQVEVTLAFEKAGEVTFDAVVTMYRE